MTSNIINLAFDSTSSLSTLVDLYISFHPFTRRATLKIALEKQSLVICKCFKKEFALFHFNFF